MDGGKVTRFLQLVVVLLVLGTPLGGYAQEPWANILQPVGTSPCNTYPFEQCAIDWTNVGIPGGIPSGTWTQSGSTLSPSGGNDTTAIQSALNSCGTDHFVLLGTGTFSITAVGVPSNCVLRGNGANNTIVECNATTNACIYAGQNAGGAADTPPSLTDATSITGGNTAGSTSITVSATTGMSVGGYLLISQLNDSNYVSNSAAANNGGAVCNCDGGIGWDGTRNQGQIVQITSIAGSTVGITSGGTGASVNPGLYWAYNQTPLAVPFSASASYAGIENLTVYSENTGSAENFYLGTCMYCWIHGVEANYADGNWAEIDWGFHDQIDNSYMSNAQQHTSGDTDSNITLRTYTSGSLVQNNILERGHFPFMVEWGAAGNVFSYNYVEGQFDEIDIESSSPYYACGNSDTACSNTPAANSHGTNPQFNLLEGNVGNIFEPDNIWGSSTWFTTFRNWWMGTSLMCGNGNANGAGRGTVSCSSGHQAWQIANTYEIEAFSTSDNLIGDVDGSTQQQALTSTQGGGSLGQVFQTTGQCGTGIPTPCGSSSRSYGSDADAFSFGYFSVSSTGGGTYDTSAPFTTALVHGVYTNMNSTINWTSGITHTLPASFYLSSEPSWWPSTMPWPAVGPDVTGGTGPGGHVYSTTAGNAAQYCYTQIMGGSDGGAGSPLTFSAATCYAASSSSAVQMSGVKISGTIIQ